jgi:hypothetical protein
MNTRTLQNWPCVVVVDFRLLLVCCSHHQHCCHQAFIHFHSKEWSIMGVTITREAGALIHCFCPFSFFTHVDAVDANDGGGSDGDGSQTARHSNPFVLGHQQVYQDLWCMPSQAQQLPQIQFH